ncbi:MAG: BrnT family toxin [Spirochaetaceae bacterium]|nr:BrnT family toxin [Spirochaetaceae bacterium]
MDFDWSPKKERDNIDKHGVDFVQAQKAWDDPDHIIYRDKKHIKRGKEVRKFCIDHDGRGVLTVRFVNRDHKVRIFGAGYWYFGRELYYE